MAFRQLRYFGWTIITTTVVENTWVSCELDAFFRNPTVPLETSCNISVARLTDQVYVGYDQLPPRHKVWAWWLQGKGFAHLTDHRSIPSSWWTYAFQYIYIDHVAGGSRMLYVILNATCFLGWISEWHGSCPTSHRDRILDLDGVLMTNRVLSHVTCVPLPGDSAVTAIGARSLLVVSFFSELWPVVELRSVSASLWPVNSDETNDGCEHIKPQGRVRML